MKLKVLPNDKKLLTSYSEVLSILSLICSFVFIFVTIPDYCKCFVGILFALILLIIYIIMWRLANIKNKIELEINNSTLLIKTGDIFAEEGLKVIAFNEYFDTIVDNRIISEVSLNGIYLRTKVNNIEQLDQLIDRDLNSKVLIVDENRATGKKKIYPLGTIFQNESYLLTAFTKFDNENRAFLSMQDYLNCLLNFWNEIDIVNAGRSVSIPLLGSGKTRFKGNTMTEQELLELLIWSFKISRIKFTYPSKVSIIIHKSKMDKINLHKLKEK